MGAIVPNHPIDNRREPRFETNNAITFSCLNKEAHYIGIPRNIILAVRIPYAVRVHVVELRARLGRLDLDHRIGWR